MNNDTGTPYPPGCTIANIRRGNGDKFRWVYANLLDPDGALLISATLEYIVARISSEIPNAEAPSYDESAVPIWEQLDAIGRSAPEGAWDSVPAAEARRTCDCCEEEREASFFCAECESRGELVEQVVPVVTWDYSDHTDTEVVEEYVYRSVCLNCCGGHSKPNVSSGANRN